MTTPEPVLTGARLDPGNGSWGWAAHPKDGLLYIPNGSALNRVDDFNRTSKPQYLAKNRFQGLYDHSAFFDEIGNFYIVNPQGKVYQRDLTASTVRAPITGDQVPEAKTLISVITDAGNGEVIDAADCVVTTRTSAMPRTRTTAPPTAPGPPAMWTTTSTSARAGPSNPTPIAPSASTASPPSATALATGASVHRTARHRRPIRRYEGAVNAPLPTGE